MSRRSPATAAWSSGTAASQRRVHLPLPLRHWRRAKSSTSATTKVRGRRLRQRRGRSRHMPDPDTGTGLAVIWDSRQPAVAEPGERWDRRRLCGSNATSAYALSGDGTTAVGLAVGSKGCDAYAFRWTEQTGMEALPRCRRCWASRANAVDFDGNVIAGFGNGPAAAPTGARPGGPPPTPRRRATT